jgi:hypothetical protein
MTTSLTDSARALPQGAMTTRSGSIWTISPRAVASGAFADRDEIAKRRIAGHALGDDDIGIDGGDEPASLQRTALSIPDASTARRSRTGAHSYPINRC